jgi:hypothetical protein
MWVEQTPKQGDTVKVEFADWTKLGTKVGVVDRFFMGNAIVDFGDCKRYLPILSTFFVYVK